MFVVDCPTHRSPVLLPVSRIRALANTETGIRVLVECWCGACLHLRTGRHAEPDRAGAPAATASGA